MAAEVTFYELPTVEVELPGYLHVGIPGENGATFIPSVDDDGILGWENDKGLENPGSVDLKALLRDTVDQEIPELDATLTVEGAAADAKAVGDAVSDLLSEAAAAVATLQSGISAVEADLDERTGAIAREIEALNAGCVKTVNGIAPDENGNVSMDIPENEQELPEVTADDDGMILQVVDGAWVAVAVSDSAVATYVDDYINSALEGDY